MIGHTTQRTQSMEVQVACLKNKFASSAACKNLPAAQLRHGKTGRLRFAARGEGGPLARICHNQAIF